VRRAPNGLFCELSASNVRIDELIKDGHQSGAKAHALRRATQIDEMRKHRFRRESAAADF